MLVKNTEYIGIITEKVICNLKKIKFNTKRTYIDNNKLDDSYIKIRKILEDKIDEIKIIEHTGNENKNIMDFKLINEETLSLKTIISNDKICPQKIGQLSKKSFNLYYKTDLNENDDKSYKEYIYRNIEKILLECIKNMLICDKTLIINYNKGYLLIIEKYKDKIINIFDNNNYKITFTKELEEWNESITIKINKISVLECQFHINRNIIKFRICLEGLLKLNILNVLNVIKYEFEKINFHVEKEVDIYYTIDYIGNKKSLLNFINESINDYVKEDVNTFIDVFGGSGSITYNILKNFKNIKNIMANDIQYYSFILLKTIANKNERIDCNKLKLIIKDLNNNEKIQKLENNFIRDNYTENSDRLYFSIENGDLIDDIRQKIEVLKEKKEINIEEYYMLLRILLIAVSKISNTSSVYGAFLKKLKKTALKKLTLEIKVLDGLINIDNTYIYDIRNLDVLDFIKELSYIDNEKSITYLDPPYNNRRYDNNYHLLETIARYDNPDIHGKTGLRDALNMTNLTSKKDIIINFKKIIEYVNTKYIIISYSTDGLMKKDEIIEILMEYRYRNIKIYEQEYKRFTAKKNVSNAILKELLICGEK